MSGKKFLIARVLKSKIVLAFCLGLFLFGLPTRVIAQQVLLQVQGQFINSQPPTSLALYQNHERRGIPGRREPAAGRGCGLSQPPVPPLTALSPKTNIGFTVAAYPQFFFYIPPASQMQTKGLKFSLVKGDKIIKNGAIMEDDAIKIYEQTFPVPNTAGIVKISLPTNKNLPPLEIGINYHWYLQVICSEQDIGDTYVNGWVQRVASNSTPSRQIEETTFKENENVSRDRNNQFWYDAVANLAQKRSSNPQDTAIALEWENLLRSEGLEKIAQKPLVFTP